MSALLVAALLPACGGGTDEPSPEPPPTTAILGQMEVEAERLGSLVQIKGREPRHLVLKSSADLFEASGLYRTDEDEKAARREVEEKVARELNVKKIDWGKHMLIALAGGEQPHLGVRVEVCGVKVDRGKLVVSWKLDDPGGGPAALGYPGAVVLVPRFDGEVVFDPPLKHRPRFRERP